MFSICNSYKSNLKVNNFHIILIEYNNSIKKKVNVAYHGNISLKIRNRVELNEEGLAVDVYDDDGY